jgi:hypothetical protein
MDLPLLENDITTIFYRHDTCVLYHLSVVLRTTGWQWSDRLLSCSAFFEYFDDIGVA